MDGLRAVALALLVCFSTLGGVAVGAVQQGAGPSMSIQPSENTSNYFGPNASDVDRSGQETTSLDVAATVSANGGEVRSTFSMVSLERKYDAAATESERRAVVRNGTERLTRRVDSLERREIEAIDRYARGEIDEADLFRTLSSIDAEAEQRAETARWLQNRANELGLSEESARLSTLRIRLTPLQGPVRDDIIDGLDGRTTARVHAEAAGGGLVLATVQRRDDGEYVYVREAYSPGIRNVRESDRYGNFAEVFNRLTEIYPWVNEGNPEVDDPDRIGTEGARLYSIVYRHDHGQLTPYLDGGTGRIVGETQRKRVDRVPVESLNRTNAGGDLRVRVDTTHASGPLGVTVYETATGQSVNASVAINGDQVGSTRGDRLWTVAPRGQTNVTVVHDGETVVVETAAS